MKNIKNYIELCKTKKGFTKDIELAEYLGITKSSMSIIKKGGGISQETALKLSQGTGEDLEAIWLACLAQREQNPVFKKALEKISKLSGVAASFFLTFQIVSPIEIFKSAVDCILCKIRIILYDCLA